MNRIAAGELMLRCGDSLLRGSPAICSAREAPAIGLSAPVVRFGFRGIEALSPFVEFVSQRVYAPSVI